MELFDQPPGFPEVIMVRFHCPQCCAALKAPDAKAGRRITCPRCKNKVVVSDPENEKADYASLDVSAGPPTLSQHQDSRSSTKVVWPPWVLIAAGVGGTVLLVGCLGIGCLIAVFTFSDSKTSKERIVGTWDLEEPEQGEASRCIFYSDGTLVAPDASFDVREVHYRFVDENTIEVTLRPSQLTSKSRPMRMHVQFLSDDKLVLTSPDGRKRKHRRVK
jgi:DNA-directed RNA polymerase subunit RPC12/RpoP